MSSTLNLATVGIPPSYWAHVPMTVQQLNDLKLVDGIFCWVEGIHHVPVTRCLLVGYIVSQSVRASDGASLYVLDDGTGLIDCMAWAKAPNDVYHLPVLKKGSSTHHQENWKVGGMIKVFGKIQCVAIEGHDVVVKEVQATLVDRVSRWDVEVNHWHACVDRAETMVRNPEEFTAAKYLNLLGPDITAQVRERRMLPAKDDTVKEWRVFGMSCSCCLSYKHDLLYCHCIAGIEPLDPEFIFRDALLKHLMKKQSTQKKALTFLYKDIKIDAQLRWVAATSVATTMGNEPPDIQLQVDRLFKSTFRYLRTDGVVYLLDEHFDQYLLIGRKCVLEPYVKKELKSDPSGARSFIRIHEGPPYLRQVKAEKLLYIKRYLSDLPAPT